MKSRSRFAIALTLAAVLGGWLIWTSIGGSLETYTSPSGLVKTSDGTTYRLNGKVAPIAHAAYEAATSMLTTGSEYIKAGLEEARGGESAPEAAPDDEATTTTSA